MKLLLDTHIWIWSILEPERLASNVAEALEASENELWLSPISVWETVILAEKGRIMLDPEPEEWVRTALSKVPMKEAFINHEIALLSRKLNLDHQDPADRFIAATAVVYGLTLLTEDTRLQNVPGLSVFSSKSPIRS